MSVPPTSGEGGERLGRYTLLQRLDVGGMAEVFLARQDGVAGFKKTVVIKRVLPQLAVDPRFVEMFLAEANLVAMLHHQNVVQVLELGEIEGTYFIALEYVDGLTLHRLAVRSWRNRRPVPMELACSAIADAALGLHHAHTAKAPDGTPLGLVHRDITPDNMMIDREGVTKVLDFGIAKSTNENIDDGRPKTQTGEMKGKLPFVPPEQLIGDYLDARTDIYTLGVGLYWLLTGRRPLTGAHDLELMTNIMKVTPARPSTHNPQIPRGLDDLILQMLEKDRRLRPQTAEEVHDALSFALAARRKTVAPFVVETLALPRQEGDDRMPATMEGIEACRPATEVFKAFSESGSFVLPGGDDLDVTSAEDSPVTGPDLGIADEVADADVVADVADVDDVDDVAGADVADATATVYPAGDTVVTTAPMANDVAPGSTAIAEGLDPLATSTTMLMPDAAPVRRSRAPIPAAIGAIAVLGLGFVVLRQPAGAPGDGDATVASAPPVAPPPPVIETAPVAPPPPVVETAPVETAPVETAPVETAPVETAPVEAAPVEAVVVAVSGPAHVQWWCGGKPLSVSAGKVKLPATARAIVAVDTRTGGRTVIPVPASRAVDYGALPRGRLVVRAKPWADVTLAKQALGQTPFAPVDLVAGTYVVKLAFEAREEKQTIEVKPGAEARVAVDFTKKKQSTARSAPWRRSARGTASA